ncbi:amino acid ABC transporter permease [Phyllobacterium myrsinacearum]|uniref:Polar amino acid transport system permease protein n=1 Tax=Phyllobacterium myrsinacearum TaxID=28101 RepID=A0A839EL06_9HYPH|nr:amino acid ABC transporter permease [Phyllobacterium myrsinacearum]MBA8879509.1 polar amino acid transport system permease protein [Phyllobacterium myrsinacearum]
MLDSILAGFVTYTKSLGFNFGFLTSVYERTIWIDGISMTLILIAVTIPVSLVGGGLLAAALTSGRKYLSVPARVFVELTRNTPTLVQLMCAFLVVNMLISKALGGAQYNPFSPFFWVVAVVGLHIAAFHAEALRAGIESVPSATLEAARAIGFNRLQILWFVEFPLALRAALPAIVNNLVNLAKLTTVGSAIAVGEVTYASIMIWSQRDNVIELMIVILLLFSLINLLIARTGRWLENKLKVPGLGI